MPPSLNVLESTARDVQEKLASGVLSSERLVSIYLTQIKQHDAYLKAMIDTAPVSQLREQARTLDSERRNGRVRSRLHGVPVIVKDNIATHPDLGMRTTAGSWALAGSKPAANAVVAQRLIEAGAIILGKANLSELNYWKGSGSICGWSAVGGQTQSAYVRGGVRPDDSFFGHSNPGGSSAGSAVAVSAGYAPVSIGTDTRGSLTIPAGRAALYTLKPTVAKISATGIVPTSHLFDQAGPLAKTPADVADLLDILIQDRPDNGYASYLNKNLASLGLVALEPEKWQTADVARKPDAGATAQLIREAHEAYNLLRKNAGAFHIDRHVLNPDSLSMNGTDCVDSLLHADCRSALNDYFSSLTESPVRTLQELIKYNKKHAESELPPDNPKQNLLEKSQLNSISREQYDAVLASTRRVGRTEGIDRVLKEYNADAIVGPIESRLFHFAAAAGYPICTLPVGYLEFNGRPHGLAVVASAQQEHILIQIMGAWEAMTAPRQPPRLHSQVIQPSQPKWQL